MSRVCRPPLHLVMIFAVLALVATAAAQGPVPVPGNPVPVVVQGPPVAVVNMAEIPATSLTNKSGGIRAHIQGEYTQRQTNRAAHPAGAEHTPDRGDPTVELDLAYLSASYPWPQNAPGESTKSFEGIPASGWIPPDTSLAVGEEYIVEAVNTGFQVFAKTGESVRAFTDFHNFVNLPTPWNGFCIDPRVVYDAESEKFVMLILGVDDTNLKSYFWVMVSQTSNPNGLWWIWRYDSTTGSPGAEQWMDYASLGVDHWGVYVVGNLFGFAQHIGFQGVQLWTLNRALMSGGASDGIFWRGLVWPNNDLAFSLQIAHPHTADPLNRTFLINNYPSAGTQVCLWTLNGDRFVGQGLGTASLTSVAIDARSYYGIYMNVDQPGSDIDIDAGDSRIMNAVYSNGKVYTTFHLDWDGSGSYSEVYVAAFNVDDGTKAWDHTLWNLEYFMFYPALTIEGADTEPNWMVAMSMTVPNDPAGFAGSIAVTHDPASDTGSFTWDRLGLGPYVILDGNGRNRWGDYSMATYDWSCGNAWGAAEYATANNSYATSIFARTMDDEPPCPYIHIANPNNGGSFLAGTALSAQWSSMNLPVGDELWVDFNDGTSVSTFGPFAATTTSLVLGVPNSGTSSNASITVGSWDPTGLRWRAQDETDFNFSVIGVPDLEAATISLTSTTMGIGETAEVSEALLNIGKAEATAFDVELRLSANDICSTADDLLATRSVSALGAGMNNSANPSVTIPPATSTGTRYLCLLVDPGNAVPEFDETNNTLYMAVTVIDVNIFADGFEGGGFTAWSSHMP